MTNYDDLIDQILFEWALKVKHGGSRWDSTAKEDMELLKEAMLDAGVPYSIAELWVTTITTEDNTADQNTSTQHKDRKEKKSKEPEEEEKPKKDDEQDLRDRAEAGDVAADLAVQNMDKEKEEEVDREKEKQIKK